jgi:hypothetical protein
MSMPDANEDQAAQWKESLEGAPISLFALETEDSVTEIW